MKPLMAITFLLGWIAYVVLLPFVMVAGVAQTLCFMTQPDWDPFIEIK